MIHKESITDKWSIYPLEDVAEFLDNKRRPIKESEREPGPYNYYGANGLQGTINDYIFDESLVLLAEDGGNFGHPTKTIAYIASGKYWVNNHAHVLKPREGVDLYYLCRVLENYNVLPFTSGTTRAKLTKGSASKIPIPLPPLPEQRRIAAILDKADALRDKRKKSIAKLDELLQSVFHDMFGDPITNPKGWDIVELEELLDFITSGSRGWAKYYSDIGDTFIRIQNLQNGQLNLNEIAFVNPPKSAEAKRTKVQSGDVLVSITADLGRVGVVPQSIGDAYVNQHIAILRVKEIQPSFLAFYLASSGGKAQFNRLNRQGVKAGLNFDDLRKLKILIPPISLQNEFVQFQDKLMQNSKKLLDSKVSIEMLFSSLQQRAFRGEL